MIYNVVDLKYKIKKYMVKSLMYLYKISPETVTFTVWILTQKH